MIDTLLDTLLLIALFTLWFSLGVAFGWKARDIYRDRLDILAASTPNEYVTVPVYVVHWCKNDESYVAVVDGIVGGSTDVENYGDLHDAVHDMVYTLTGTDRFWLEWKPILPGFS